MGLGMPEVVLILVIALIVFGPRKLPELGKSLGQAMQQFRRASEDFKRTWEQEVELDNVRKTSTAAGDSSHDYNSSHNYNDPYNPYGSETDSSHQTAALPAEGQTGSNAVSNTAAHEIAKPEAAAAGAVTNSNSAGTDSKQKHWI